MGSDITSKYLFCLFTDTIGDQCADEIERVLEQRAISVNLHPEIEDQCRLDLTQNCINDIQPGEELQCLQENFENLQVWVAFFLHLDFL